MSNSQVENSLMPSTETWSEAGGGNSGSPPRRRDILPRSLPPIGICREEAAAYIGVSPTKFDQLVADGRMPKPKKVDGRRIWCVKALTVAFKALAEEDSKKNEWDN